MGVNLVSLSEFTYYFLQDYCVDTSILWIQTWRRCSFPKQRDQQTKKEMGTWLLSLHRQEWVMNWSYITSPPFSSLFQREIFSIVYTQGVNDGVGPSPHKTQDRLCNIYIYFSCLCLHKMCITHSILQQWLTVPCSTASRLPRSWLQSLQNQLFHFIFIFLSNW